MEKVAFSIEFSFFSNFKNCIYIIILDVLVIRIHVDEVYVCSTTVNNLPLHF